MVDDGVLRQRIRDAIDAGKLPDCSPVGMWGGPGCGAACAICGEQIRIDEVEFELEFSARDELGWFQAAGNGLNGHGAENGARSSGNGNGNGSGNGNGHGPHANGSGSGSGDGRDNLHMHLRCHAAWDVARQESNETQTLGARLPAQDGRGTISSREREPTSERGPE